MSGCMFYVFALSLILFVQHVVLPVDIVGLFLLFVCECLLKMYMMILLTNVVVVVDV